MLYLKDKAGCLRILDMAFCAKNFHPKFSIKNFPPQWPKHKVLMREGVFQLIFICPIVKSVLKWQQSAEQLEEDGEASDLMTLPPPGIAFLKFLSLEENSCGWNNCQLNPVLSVFSPWVFPQTYLETRLEAGQGGERQSHDQDSMAASDASPVWELSWAKPPVCITHLGHVLGHTTTTIIT